MFVVDLDKLYLGELFEGLGERLRNVVKRAIGLAHACEIDVRDAVGEGEFAVAGETVEHEGETAVAFDVARTFKEFIERRAQQILIGGDETRRLALIRKLPGDQAIVICEVDIDLHEQGRARGLRRLRRRSRSSRCERE